MLPLHRRPAYEPPYRPGGCTGLYVFVALIVSALAHLWWSTSSLTRRNTAPADSLPRS